MGSTLYVLYVSQFFSIFGFISAVTQDLKYSVKEESAIGYLIGNIKLDSKISEKVSDPVMSLVDDEDDVKKYFRLMEKTGEFFVAGRIDRETLCSYKEVGELDSSKQTSCKLTMTVFVPKEHWINIEINVQDINDHEPVFEQKSRTIEIDERVSIGFEVTLTLAKDPDIGSNSIQTYHLFDRTNQFDIRYERPFTLSLILKSKLDYDKPNGKNFTLYLTACDGGQPKKCGNQTLFIWINDYNDNQPVFSKSEYVVNVSESTAVGSEIIRIMATDKDSGLYGTISYYIFEAINNQHQLSSNPFFKVSKNSGQIILNRKLNAKQTPSFSIRLEAHDNGELPLMGLSILKIFVEDINDHAPTITLKPQSSNPNCSLSFYENNIRGSHVGLVIATDDDVGNNGKVSCSLHNTQGKIQLKMSNSGDDRIIFSLITNHVFDREQESYFDVEIKCSDKGTPTLSSSKLVTMCILDMNEFPPEVDESEKVVNISEDVPIGSEVFTVKFRDRDSTKNVSFSLVGNSLKYFSIGKENGKIKTSSELDREKFERLVLTIKIEDDKSMGKGFTVTTSLTVSLFDANDNKPRLVKPNAVYNILEGVYELKQKLFQLEAVDNDFGQNAKVEFTVNYVESGNEKLKYSVFNIDKATGEVFALVELDREKHDSFKISVLLTDKGFPPLTNEEFVFINVLDKNDHEPLWMFPRTEESVANVTKVIYPGQVITTVKAVDYDTLENANVTYSIISVDPADEKNLFKIKITGEIQITEVLKHKKYVLNLQATDNGNPPLSSKSVPLKIRYWPLETGGFFVSSDSISFTLIIVMASVTSLICICLMIAIVTVRRHHGYRCPTSHNLSNYMYPIDAEQNRSHFVTTGNEQLYLDQVANNASIVANKWSDNYATLSNHSYSLQSKKHNIHDTQISYLGEPLLQTVSTRCINSPHEFNTLKNFRPVIGEHDGSSADSGHGVSEEDQLHSDLLRNDDVNPHSYPNVADSKSFFDMGYLPSMGCPKMNILSNKSFYSHLDMDDNLPNNPNRHMASIYGGGNSLQSFCPGKPSNSHI